MHEMDPLYIPIIGILMPLVLVPTILILKHRHSRREWDHKERMKAMEIRLPGSTSEVPGIGRAVAQIGAGVPIISVLAAFVTTLTWDPVTGGDVPIPAVAWGCASLISALALGSSLILAKMHPRTTTVADTAHEMNNGKPLFDPDAYDVVSSRA
jgi:hypothetical protein